MKNLIWMLLFVSVIGCKKEIPAPISAEQEFKSLPELYRPTYLPHDSLNVKINYIQEAVGMDGFTTYLFYRTDQTDAKLMNTSKVSFVKGLGNICCVAYYGGPTLPGGNEMEIYQKTDGQLLKSPTDSLVFNDVKSKDNNLLIQFVSQASYLNNLNSRGQLMNLANLRFYYGRYNINQKTLIMDSK